MLLASCGQAAQVPAPSASSPAAKTAESKPAPAASQLASSSAQADWDKAVAAAKQEGKLAVVLAPGDSYRRVITDFEQKYGITAQTLVGNGQADLAPRLDTERKASRFLWDVAMHSPAAQFDGFKVIGALTPLRPALALPEVLDDSKWLGGFEAGWNDKEKAYGYTFIGEMLYAVHVNRNSIQEAQLSKLDQLWDPRWKGKIAMQDPRVPSSGTQKLSAFLRLKGEDKLRSFLQTQQPVLTQDRRQLSEWVVRGQYPIGLGVVPSVLSDFAKQGLDISSVKPLDREDPAAKALSGGAGAIGLFVNAPHPNAAKVFANWLLSREGGVSFSRAAGYNSRRLDVPIVDPDGAVDPTDYKNVNRSDADLEDSYPTYQQAIEISKQILK